ncbi:MAG: stage V sporulation protein AD [Lachnospiraceae bacterium]|nr:stage V sporulation protein AD [Lachnospiraceae bacterium]
MDIQRKGLGSASVRFQNPVYIIESATVVGKKESEGPLGQWFDETYEDDSLGCENWEDAECELQRKAVSLLLHKKDMSEKKIRYILAGDLLGQSIASSFGLKDFEIPFWGLYSACSTCGEALSFGSILIDGGYAANVVCVTSSHFASAEKEFRYPLEYGSQRPKCSTWTVTGSGAYLLSGIKPDNDDAIAITGITTGRVVDYGIKDSMNMGACMAPAAAMTIENHFRDFETCPGDYDQIITGDLGAVGSSVLIDLLAERGYDIAGRHMDCGMEIFNEELQDTNAGGSGCGCAATVLGALVLRKLRFGKMRKVLFVPTGALLSKVSFNEGKTIPGIAHAVMIEKLN